MEKIVILTGNDGDENLVNCIRMLFPECSIEVHEKRPGLRSPDLPASCRPKDKNFDERLEKYLGLL